MLIETDVKEEAVPCIDVVRVAAGHPGRDHDTANPREDCGVSPWAREGQCA